MLATLADILADVKLRLSEPTNTSIGALASGAGGALDAATDAAITQLANEAVADLCRRGGLAIEGIGTVAALASGATNVSFSTLTVSGGTLWAAHRTGMVWNSAAVSRIKRGLAAAYGATASPAQYWYGAGSGSITLLSATSSVAVLTVPGLVIPTPMAATTDPITPWLPQDLGKLISFYCCHYVAKKAMDDPTMQIRMTPWGNDYEEGRMALLARLLNEDPGAYSEHYAGLLPVPGGK